ncbi:ribbon-helix-helix protein, CopG family [Brachybacterium squillarum]|uniref:ribbon-helix-helix protein, CopG family n=1 Tax=Brachybacterium squillarum TaxID=661979 RepID=UPI0003079945|nr:ribbon-helix-helix protein, CopG family [Brachybacterium squillarum]
MAMNLRLPDDLAEALRAEAARRGESQQAVVRQALAEKLGVASAETPLLAAVRRGLVGPPSPFRDQAPPLRHPGERSTLDLLDRDDRV